MTIRYRWGHLSLVFCLGALLGCGVKKEPDKGPSALTGYWQGTFKRSGASTLGSNRDTSKADLYFGKESDFKLSLPAIGKEVKGDYYQFSDVGTLTLDYRNADVPEFGLVGDETEDYEYHLEDGQLLLRSEKSSFTLKKRAADEKPVYGMDGHWLCKDRSDFDWRFYIHGAKFQGSVSKEKASATYLQGVVSYIGDQIKGNYKMTDVAILQLTEAEPTKPFDRVRAYLTNSTSGSSSLKLVVLDSEGKEKEGSNAILKCSN